ncbi:TIGR01777 family oxidoreductase [Chamaesiphon sp. OTE_8_metabat_110]|uniref:thylakoid membrane protein ThyD n=1 Tax=Chamaesiphon sp. OTE_8_metabat_110 TaxID=2964696 RepID=UPI00286AFB91|nr:TIGR01777 family oxidoreductase [Chamaesiphon sp. OTE_8_metabat_110]
MKIAIAGATGFVGSRLVEQLQAQGHEVVIFTRSPQQASNRFGRAQIVGYSPLQSGAWQESISGCDAVVNLAGEPIAEKRWTPDHKRTILESRQIGTQKIVEAISQSSVKPSVLINASAIGYYGTSETSKFDETSPAGKDFLAEVCTAWETAAQAVTNTGTRLVILRMGIVLGENGGVLGKMLAPFSAFVGGPIGSGKQWFSWVHRDDVVKLIIQAITDPQMQGVYNATAPNPVTMEVFSQTLGSVMNRPSWLPVPNFALEALLGEGAIVVLQGQQVVPTHTLAQGFDFQYSTIKPALAAILGS